MSDLTLKLSVASSSGGAGLILSPEEIKHIRNCRALKPEARVMVFDLTILYMRTLPARGPQLALARPANE